jgi:ribosome-binding factor A
MEVIGKTNTGYIVEILSHELKRLTGHNVHVNEVRVGAIIEVDKLYYQLQNLVSQEDEIKKIVHTLKTAAGMLKKIDPIFYKEE